MFFRKKKKQEELDPFAKDIADTAEACVAHFEAADKLLDYSPASMAVVEEILGEASDYAEELQPEQLNWLISGLGSYIFETARRQFGGKYYWFEKFEQPVLTVGEPEFKISLLAFEKVKMRLKNGPEDQIPFFFRGFEEKVKEAKAGDQALIV